MEKSPRTAVDPLAVIDRIEQERVTNRFVDLDSQESIDSFRDYLTSRPGEGGYIEATEEAEEPVGPESGIFSGDIFYNTDTGNGKAAYAIGDKRQIGAEEVFLVTAEYRDQNGKARRAVMEMTEEKAKQYIASRGAYLLEPGYDRQIASEISSLYTTPETPALGTSEPEEAPTPTEPEPEPTPEPLSGDEVEGAGTDDTSGGAAPTEPMPGDNPTGTETGPEVKTFGIFNSDMSMQEAVERAIQHLDACKPEDIAASYDTLTDDMQHLVLYHKGEGTPDWGEPARALANFKTPVREYYEQKKSKPKASRAEAPVPIPSANKESSSATAAPVAEAKPAGGPAAAENTSWRERVAVVRKRIGRAAIGVRSGLQDFWTWLKDQESETAASAEGLEEFEKLKAQLTPDAMRTRLQSSAQGRDYIFAAIERVGKLGREHATDWPQDAIREAQQGALLDRLRDVEEGLEAEQPSA